MIPGHRGARFARCRKATAARARCMPASRTFLAFAQGGVRVRRASIERMTTRPFLHIGCVAIILIGCVYDGWRRVGVRSLRSRVSPRCVVSPHRRGAHMAVARANRWVNRQYRDARIAQRPCSGYFRQASRANPQGARPPRGVAWVFIACANGRFRRRAAPCRLLRTPGSRSMASSDAGLVRICFVIAASAVSRARRGRLPELRPDVSPCSLSAVILCADAASRTQTPRPRGRH